MSDEIDSYIQLQQQIHRALRVQHPNWVEPNGDYPPATYMSHASPNCSAFLTGRTAGGVTVERVD